MQKFRDDVAKMGVSHLSSFHLSGVRATECLIEQLRDEKIYKTCIERLFYSISQQYFRLLLGNTDSTQSKHSE